MFFGKSLVLIGSGVLGVVLELDVEFSGISTGMNNIWSHSAATVEHIRRPGNERSHAAEIDLKRDIYVDVRG